MNDEPRLFEMPPDPADKLRPVLRYHERALEKAEARLEAAAEKVTYEREQLERIEAAIAQILLQKRNAGRPAILADEGARLHEVARTAAAIVNEGALGENVSATVNGVAVAFDPASGEVVDP